MDEVEKLILSLRNGKVQTRRDSAYLLGEKGDSRAIPVLSQALQDNDEYVRARARDSLRQLNVPVADDVIPEKQNRQNATGVGGSLSVFRYLSDRPALGLILGICILGLGTVIFKWPRIISSSWWPTVVGVVTSSEVEGGIGTSDYDSGWWPNVSYNYHVDGKTYTANNIEVIDVGNGNTDNYAKQVVERYPVGKEVQVHFDPGNPAIAVLDPGIPTNIGGLNSITFIAFQVGVVVIGVGSFCIGLAGIFGIKTYKHQPNNHYIEGG